MNTVKPVSSKLSLFFSFNLYNFGFFSKKDYKTFNLKWIPLTFVVKPVSSKLSLFFHFWDGKRTSKVKRMNQPSMWIHTLNQTFQNETKLANFFGRIHIEREALKLKKLKRRGNTFWILWVEKPRANSLVFRKASKINPSHNISFNPLIQLDCSEF